MSDLIQCRLIWSMENDLPSLVIGFSELLTNLEIGELTDLLAQTAVKWSNCRRCSHEFCDKSKGGSPETKH